MEHTCDDDEDRPVANCARCRGICEVEERHRYANWDDILERIFNLEQHIKELEAQIEESKPAWVTEQIRAGNFVKDGDIKTLREQWEEEAEKFRMEYEVTTSGNNEGRKT